MHGQFFHMRVGVAYGLLVDPLLGSAEKSSEPILDLRTHLFVLNFVGNSLCNSAQTLNGNWNMSRFQLYQHRCFASKHVASFRGEDLEIYKTMSLIC